MQEDRFNSRFVCPDCGHPIHNRRYPLCEGCKRSLPEELLYSDEQKQQFDAERESRRKAAEAKSIAERAARQTRTSGADGWFLDLFDGDGDD